MLNNAQCDNGLDFKNEENYQLNSMTRRHFKKKKGNNLVIF